MACGTVKNQNSVVYVWDETNTDMELIVLFYTNNGKEIVNEVADAFDSWCEEEANGYTRGDWVREQLEKRHDPDSFTLFFSEKWSEENG